jgi:hypothetical protein
VSEHFECVLAAAAAGGVLLRDVTVRESERGLVGWLVRRARARVDYMHDGDGESIKAKRERGHKGSSNGAYKRDIHPLSVSSQSQRQPKSECWAKTKKSIKSIKGC